jgi:acyl-CoA hydrolase
MTTFKLVMPEHLNHYGFLFGGNLLKWVDEVAWMAASIDYPACHMVTIAMNRVEFRKTAGDGAILRFEVQRVHVGHSSVTYEVHVFRRALHADSEEPIFSTAITFVRVDDQGRKTSLPPA